VEGVLQVGKEALAWSYNALQQLQNATPQDTEGRLYIVPRDLWLLQQGLTRLA
jgi:hypothetical protein